MCHQMGADFSELSARCPAGENIKVLYLSRHGHGKSSLPFAKYIQASTVQENIISFMSNTIHGNKSVELPLPIQESLILIKRSRLILIKRPRKYIHPTMQV